LDSCTSFSWILNFGNFNCRQAGIIIDADHETKNLDNIEDLGDIKGLREEFLRHHGFGMPGVDYNQDVELDIF